MQWDGTANAGFSSASPQKLYIRLDNDPDRPTVERQIADKTSLYHEVKKLIAVRQAHPALLSRGAIEFVSAKENAYPLAYVRSCAGENILVVINPADREARFTCEHPKVRGASLSAESVIYSYRSSSRTENSQGQTSFRAAKKEGDTVLAPPCSVTFVQL
jgi:maltose alpha-D-glucosyltransferase/alpha-amylase